MAAASSSRQEPGVDQLGLEAVDRIVGGLGRELVGRARYLLWVSAAEWRVGPHDGGVEQGRPHAGPDVSTTSAATRRTAK